MYTGEKISEHSLKVFSGIVPIFTAYHICFPAFRQEVIAKAAAIAAARYDLSLAERLAVGALVHGGIGLMGTHQDLIQRAVVLILTVISAGLDGAFNALVCMAVH